MTTTSEKSWRALVLERDSSFYEPDEVYGFAYDPVTQDFKRKFLSTDNEDSGIYNGE